jgi:hypothetical protein
MAIKNIKIMARSGNSAWQVNPKAAVFMKLKTKNSGCQVGRQLLYKIELAVGKLCRWIEETQRKSVCVHCRPKWRTFVLKEINLRILDLANNSEVLKDCFVRRSNGRRSVSFCSHSRHFFIPTTVVLGRITIITTVLMAKVQWQSTDLQPNHYFNIQQHWIFNIGCIIYGFCMM